MLGCLWILFLFVCECVDVYGSFVFVVFVSAWLFMGVFFLPPSVCVCVCVKIHVDYNINCYSVSNILNVCVFSTCMEWQNIFFVANVTVAVLAAGFK